MSDSETPDPFLEELLLEVMGPAAAQLPEPLRAVLRQALSDQVLEDPDLQSLYRAARPRAAPIRSEEQTALDGTAAAAERAAEPPKAVPLRRKGGAA